MPYFDVADATLHYTLTGHEGPFVVCLTGYAVGGGVWEDQVAALSPEHRVVCLDNRGGGLTRAPTAPWTMATLARDVIALMDHLDAFDVHLVGCSMGGMIAQEVALLAKDRLRSLTLITTHAGRIRDRLPRLETALGFVKSNVGSREGRRAAVASLLFPDAYLASGPRERIAHALDRDFLEQPPLVDRLAQLGAIMRHDTAGRLHRLVGLPTLIIVAGQDKLIPPSGCEALATLIPGARRHRFAEAGHGVIGQCADAVNQLLREHISTAAGRHRSTRCAA